MEWFYLQTSLQNEGASTELPDMCSGREKVIYTKFVKAESACNWDVGKKHKTKLTAKASSFLKYIIM
jgi:hypothetical protein